MAIEIGRFRKSVPDRVEKFGILGTGIASPDKDYFKEPESTEYLVNTNPDRLVIRTQPGVKLRRIGVGDNSTFYEATKYSEETHEEVKYFARLDLIIDGVQVSRLIELDKEQLPERFRKVCK